MRQFTPAIALVLFALWLETVGDGKAFAVAALLILSAACVISGLDARRRFARGKRR